MAKKKTDLSGLSGLVYSTDPNFRLPEEEISHQVVLPQEQDLRVWLEKNHRGGKTATVIRQFNGTNAELEALCKTLKSKLGTGGSAKDGEIIIQGDHRSKIGAILSKLGYKYKLAGG